MFADFSLFFKTIDPVFYLVLGLVIPTLLLVFLWFSRQKSPARASKSETPQGKQTGILIKGLSEGLNKTRALLSGRLDALFQNKNPLDHKLLESVHETLYKSDMGVTTTDKLVAHLEAAARKEEVCDAGFVKDCLSKKVLEILKFSRGSEGASESIPHIILVVGVNGAGKTTTIGKLASKFLDQGKTVSVCAGDTYRAAATQQLKIWGDRLGIKVFSQKEGADPAAVAFDAVKGTVSKGTDILIVDTAGRLQNKKGLMEELAKIKRAIKKECPGAPHETLMVLDATMGQNALQQVSAFKEFVEITGLIVTKLDGTAKGGVIVALADKFKIPVKYIGIGEAISDLKPFSPEEYVKSIL